MTMPRLAKHLSAKSSAIVDTWLGMLLDCYPMETARFMRKKGDPFANPMTHHLVRGLKDTLAALVEEWEAEAAQAALDEVIRVQALQDFPPSRALAFIFFLKQVIREELAQELEDMSLAKELVALESTIDGLALLGFDSYMQRREKLCDIKVNEMKSRISGLLRKSGIEIDNP